jgi:hypothetical protein
MFKSISRWTQWFFPHPFQVAVSARWCSDIPSINRSNPVWNRLKPTIAIINQLQIPWNHHVCWFILHVCWGLILLNHHLCWFYPINPIRSPFWQIIYSYLNPKITTSWVPLSSDRTLPKMRNWSRGWTVGLRNVKNHGWWLQYVSICKHRNSMMTPNDYFNIFLVV